MEKKKIDKIIESFRKHKNLKEEMMTANPPGQGGGGGSQIDPKGTQGLVGFDPVLNFVRRKKIDYRTVPSDYKKWVKSVENKYK